MSSFLGPEREEERGRERASMEILLIKAVKFFIKSWKLMVFIGLIFFPFVYLLYFLFDHFFPLVNDNFTQISSTQKIGLTSLSPLMIIETIFIIIYYIIVYFFFSIATISLSSLSYSKKEDITMKELLLHFRCKRWKGPIITYISNTTLILGSLIFYFTYTSKIQVSTIWVPILILGLVLGYVGIYVLFLGFVISVVEDDCNELQPLIGRTTDVLLKEKGVQLLAVIPIRFIGSWVLALIYEEIMDTNMEGSQFLGRVLLALGNIVIEMFIMVVYLIYYCETVEHKRTLLMEI